MRMSIRVGRIVALSSREFWKPTCLSPPSMISPAASVVRTFAVGVAVVAFAAAAQTAGADGGEALAPPAAAQAETAPAPMPVETELHVAPEARRANAPPESSLSPPDEAEGVEPALGFSQVANPAFPARTVAGLPGVGAIGLMGHVNVRPGVPE